MDDAEVSIHPTGTCFDDMLDTLVDILRMHPERVDTLCLVHALIQPDGTSLHSHAWLESADSVLFSLLVEGALQYFQAEKAAYYAETRPTLVQRYTYPQALGLNRLSGHYGPWDARIRALCKASREGGTI